MGVSTQWAEKADEILKPDGSRPWRAQVASMISEAVQDIEDPVIVDVGCGPHSWMLANAGVERGTKIGLDLDPDISENREVDHVAFAPAERLPLKSNSADLIISSYVIEHLPDPEEAFREFARVLKPGGKLIVWASNKWNYAIFVSSLTPTGLHNLVRRVSLRDATKDNCPTYYRANTSRALRKCVRQAGLDTFRVSFGANAYRYWGFWKALFALAALGSRAISATPLRCLKLVLIVSARKPS